jgi:hypothetical protein
MCDGQPKRSALSTSHARLRGTFAGQLENHLASGSITGSEVEKRELGREALADVEPQALILQLHELLLPPRVGNRRYVRFDDRRQNGAHRAQLRLELQRTCSPLTVDERGE